MDNNINIAPKEIAPGVFSTGGSASIPTTNPINGSSNQGLITANSLQPVTPVNVITPTNMGTPSIEGDVAFFKAQTEQAKTAQETALAQQQDTGNNELTKLLSSFGQQGTEQLSLEQKIVNPLQTQIADVTGQANVLTAEYNSLKTSFEKQSSDIEAGAGVKGLTTGAVMGQQGAVARAALARLNSKASEIGLLQAQSLALQGKADLAQKQIDRAIDLKYKGVEQEIKIKQFQLEQIGGKLTDEEKKRADALTFALNRDATRVAEKKQSEKDIEKMLINATSQDVPKDVLAEAQRFAKKGDKLGVAQALGVFTGDKLARDIQLSNLLTDTAQRANIYSTIAQRNKETDAGVSEKVLTKVQSSSEYKTISGILPAIKAIKDYRDSVEKFGSFESLSGKGKGEKRATYGNAIASWKTLAGLGALSGADFGLAENVIPQGGKLFARNSTQLAQLDAALLNAVSQAEVLTTRMSQINPSAAGLLQQQLGDIKTVGGLMVTIDPLNLGVKNTEGSNPLGI